MEDRRQNDRIDTHGAGLTAHNSVNGEAIGIIGNLSPGGMMLICNQELYPDGILQLAIKPPPGTDFAPVQMGLKVLWCTPANSPSEFWAGLETIDISQANLTALRQLLGQLDQGG